MPSTTYQLRVRENRACYTFALHVANCRTCLELRQPLPSYQGLCLKGIKMRDDHIEAARDYAEVDTEFARRYASLIA